MIHSNFYQSAAEQKRLPPRLETRGFELLSILHNDLLKMLGPPIRNFSSISIFSSLVGPAIYFTGDQAKIFVGTNALNYEPTFLANLAHESVHLFEGTFGRASGFEEGFAVYFELATIESHYGILEREHFTRHLPKSYSTVFTDYAKLCENSENPARHVRRKFGRLTGISTLQFRRVFPTISWRTAFRFASRKRMR